MTALSLSSSAFLDGAEIPKKYGYKHGNSSPPLTIDNIPDGCKSLALVMDDPDALKPAGKVWVHWVLWNVLPSVREISESTTPADSLEGITDFGETGYGGPAPPDARHTYIFTLYALDSTLDIPSGSDKKTLENSMQGHIIEKTVFTGTYAPQ